MDLIINGKRVDKSPILYYIENGQKIVAIKILKEQTNIGLQESKEIVDNLELNPDYYDGEEQIIETNIGFTESRVSDFKTNHDVGFDKKDVKITRRGKYLKDKADTRYDVYLILFVVFVVIVTMYLFFNQ